MSTESGGAITDNEAMWASIPTIVVPHGVVLVKRTSPVPLKRTPLRKHPGGEAMSRAGGREWFGDRLFVEKQQGHKRAGYTASIVAHVVVALVLTAAVLMGAEHPGTFTVFGPRTLTRTAGAPNIFDFTFGVPNPSLPYILQIENDGIAAAIVTVNGTQIVGPSDFNPHVTIIERTIAVRESNALHVELRSKPGSRLTIRVLGRDDSPPTITATAIPAANAAGWNRTDVQVTFACSDTGSGIATCPPSKIVTTEGASQIVAGTAVDNAGNTANGKVTLNIDKTAPTVAASVAPPPNADGWIDRPATVTFACEDDRSGVASCPPPIAISADGANQIARGTASDNAGNTAEASLSINVDRTAPVIVATLDRPPNGIGWNHTDVTITFTCNDAASGISFCPAPITISSDGANQSISGTARDRAGNTAATSVSISVDKTAPSIVAAASPSPNVHGWNKTDVVVSFACSDAGAGIVSCPDPVTATSEGANQIVTRTTADKAGNTATASVTLNIDKSPPAITPSASPAPNDAGWNNSDVNVTFACEDNPAGVDTCASPFLVATEGAGRVVRGVATDRAGNEAAAELTVNLDKTLPIVSIASPQSGAILRTSPTSLSGNVSDLLSGIASATCHGAAVTPGAGGLVSCGPALVSGSNTLTLAATDAAGNVATAPVDVTYEVNRPPIGTAGGPYTGFVGEPINFAATATDPDSDPLTFTWDFGNGPVDGQTATHTYASAGSFSVELVIADDHGGTTTGTAQVTIVPVVQPNRPPSANAGGAYAGDVGQDIAFNGTASTDPDDDSLTYVWTFGDGGTATGPSPTHIFVTSGAYTVTLTVNDGRGGMSSASTQAIVNAVAPPAANRGMVRGEVYDDSKGLPLAGADVMLLVDGGTPLSNPVTVTGDERGQFALPAQQGNAILRISKSGFTTVERIVSIPSSTAITALDARLTPLDPRVNQLQPALNDVARTAAGDVTITLPPGSVATDVSLRVTSISGQGLEGRLPYGWSPAAAVDIDPPGVVFQQTAQLSVPNTASLAAGSAVVVAVYDVNQHRWTAIAPGLVSADGRTLTSGLDSSGQYAFLAADDPPFMPPQPIAGSPLTGVAAVALAPADGASGSVVPRAAPPGDNARAIGTIDLRPAAPRPSGTVLQAYVTERYNLFDSSHVVPPSFTQDIVLYARPAPRSGAALGTSFRITPSIAFSIQQLERGVVALDVNAPIADTGGTIAGPSGGTATDASGNFVQVPAGAVATETIVEIAAVLPERIAVAPPAGFQQLGALQLSLGGQSLTQSAALSIPRPPGLADTAQVIVAEIISDPRGVRRLRIVGVGRIASGRVALQTTLNALVFPGVTHGGPYLFLATPAPLGFIAGSVSAIDGAPQSQALVSADNAPFSDITGAAGAYIVAGAINVASHVTAVAPATTITGTTTLTAINQIAQLDLTLDAVTLTVVSTLPPSNAVKVPLNSPVVIQFSEPLEAGTADAASIALQTSGSPVSGSIALSPDRRIATFLPAQELHSNSVYSLTLSSALRGDSGTKLPPFTPITFTTVDTSKPQVALGQITADLPDADGYVLIFGTSGISEPNNGVTAANLRTQETVTVLASTDGSFRMRLPAAIGDEIGVTLRDAQSRETTIAITQFEGADGTMGIGRAGGRITGAGGRIGMVRARALTGAATFKVSNLADQTALPALPSELTYADRFTLSFQGGPFNQLRSLTLTESQNRFAALALTNAPFESSGSLVVPADFLVNGTVKFSATAEDAGGDRNTASGSTFVVTSTPATESVETKSDAAFPTVFLIAPKEAMPSQQVGVTAIAPTARVDFDLPAPAGLDAAATVLLARATLVGTERKLAIVDQFARVDVNGITRLKTAGRPLPGASAAGHYGLVLSSVPLAFVSGEIAGPSRIVAVDGSPFIVEPSGPNARFLIPVVANKPFVLNFIDPSTGQVAATASGQAPPTGTIALQNPIVGAGAPLTVMAVPDAGSLADVNTPIVFTFSAPIDGRTLAGNILITDAAGIETFGRLRMSADGLRVTFVPNRRWRFGATYRYAVSTGLVAMSGGHLPQNFAGSFTTFAPKLIGTLAAGTIRDVAVTGVTLVAGGAAGMAVIDVDRPEAPAQVSQISAGAAVGGVAIDGSRALAMVASDAVGTRLHVYDLTNRSSPSPVGSGTQLHAPGSGGMAGAVALASAQRALGAVQSIGVASIDLDTSTVSARYPASAADGANHVAVVGDRALVAGASGLTILDVATLDRLSTTSTGGNAQGVAGLSAFPMDLNGDGTIDPESEIFNLAVVANGSDGTLQFFNISDAASPRLIAAVRLAGETASVALDANENLAYVGNGTRGLALVDLSGPASIQPIDLNRDSVDDRVLGTVLTRAAAGRMALSLARGIAYVADGVAGLAVVQVVPPRTNFEAVLRDPVAAATGDEQSIADTHEAFVTDEALQVTVNAVIPPQSSLFLTVEESPEAGGPRLLTLADDATSTPLASGANTVTVRVRRSQGATGRRATLKIHDTSGAVAGKFDLRLIQPSADPAALVSIFVAPETAVIRADEQNVQLSVGGLFADGRFLNLSDASSGTTYVVEQPAVATVDANGIVTALAGGRTSVRANHRGLTASSLVSVRHAVTLTAIETNEPYVTLTAAGAQQRLSLVGRLSSGALEDVAAGFGSGYTSSDTSVVTVNEDGVVTAVGEGTAIITITNGSLQRRIRVATEFRTPPSVTGIELRSFTDAVTTDRGEVDARAAITGSGSLEGLTVTFEIAGANVPAVTGVTDYAGVALATFTNLSTAATAQVTATIVDPASGAARSDTKPLAIERGTGDHEPNNDTASASLLTVGRTVAGTIDGQTDPRDSYRIRTTTDGTLRLTLTLPDGVTLGDFAVVVRSAAGAELGRFVPDAFTDVFSQAIPAGVNDLVVEATGDAASYMLDAAFEQAPVAVLAASPASGGPGTRVTISGSGFSLDVAENTVLFGTIAANVVAASAGALDVVVPASAANAPIRVVVNAREGTGPQFVTGNTGPPPPITLMPADPAQIRRDPVTGVLIDLTRLRVYFDPAVERAQVDTLASAAGASIAGVVPDTNTYVFEFAAVRTIRDLEAARLALQANASVRLAARSTYAQVAQLHFDTRTNAPTLFFANTGQSFSGGIAYERIRLFEAIEAIRNTPAFKDAVNLKPVTVAIIDSGFDPSLFNDFRSLASPNPVVELYDANTPLPTPNGLMAQAPSFSDTPIGHGTMVGSVIAAVNNNAGFSGALNSVFQPDETVSTKLLVYAAPEGERNISTSGVHAALADINRRGGVDVVNMSFTATHDGNSTSFQDAVREYRTWFAPLLGRTLMIAAAGNDGVDARYSVPSMLASQFDGVISVGAAAVLNTDGTGETADARASFSNYGDTVTIAAPGEDVLVATPGSSAVEQSIEQGTSFAAPMVAGIAALLQTLRANNPHFLPSELRRMLVNGGDDISRTWSPTPAHMRRLNALNTVTQLLTPPDNQVIYVADQDYDNCAPSRQGNASGPCLPPGRIIAIEIDPLTGERASPARLDREIPLRFTRGTVTFTGTKPTTIGVSPSGDKAYVVVQSVDPPGLGDGVLVINTHAMAAEHFIPFSGAAFPVQSAAYPAVTAGTAKPGLVFSRDGRLLYVATGADIAIINTHEGRIVNELSDLPFPYTDLSRTLPPLAVRKNLLRVRARGMFPDAGSPGGQRQGKVLSSLALSPDGKTLYAVVETGGGIGLQPGAILTIDVNLYKDKDPFEPFLQSDLSQYFTVQATDMLMDNAGTALGGDEPSAVAVSPDGNRVYPNDGHLYLVNGGANRFLTITPEPLPVNQYINGFGALMAGAAAVSAIGGLPGVAAGLATIGFTSAAWFNQMLLDIRKQLKEGSTLLTASGHTAVFRVDPARPADPNHPVPLGKQEWIYPGDVVYGWNPNPSGGGLLVTQFNLKEVHAKRPFGMAIRPDGERALLPYFQTGNFGVLDLQEQKKFQTSPPSGPPANSLFAPLAERMFHGVVAVTPALGFDKHLWPNRGAMRLLDAENHSFPIPSQDEALLFPWHVEYAQNGKFAVAAHTGSGKGPGQLISPRIVASCADAPYDSCGRVPFYSAGDLDVVVPLEQLGFDPRHGVPAEGQYIAVPRGGGAISVISDKAITNDLGLRSGTRVTSNQGTERAYFSMFPLCEQTLRDSDGRLLPTCTTDVLTHHYSFTSADTIGGRFFRPRGITVQPFVTFEAPRFGDHIGPGDGLMIRWRDSRVFEIDLRVLDLHDLTATGEPIEKARKSFVLSAEQLARKRLATSLTEIVTLASTLLDSRRYRIVADALSGTPMVPEILSTAHIDIRYEEPEKGLTVSIVRETAPGSGTFAAVDSVDATDGTDSQAIYRIKAEGPFNGNSVEVVVKAIDELDDPIVTLSSGISSGAIGTVTGTVVDTVGNGVVGALVGGGLTVATTGAGGQFSILVPIGKRTVDALHGASGKAGRAEVELRRPNTTITTVITLNLPAGLLGPGGVAPVPDFPPIERRLVLQRVAGSDEFLSQESLFATALPIAELATTQSGTRSVSTASVDEGRVFVAAEVSGGGGRTKKQVRQAKIPVAVTVLRGTGTTPGDDITAPFAKELVRGASKIWQKGRTGDSSHHACNGSILFELKNFVEQRVSDNPSQGFDLENGINDADEFLKASQATSMLLKLEHLNLFLVRGILGTGAPTIQLNGSNAAGLLFRPGEAAGFLEESMFGDPHDAVMQAIVRPESIADVLSIVTAHEFGHYLSLTHTAFQRLMNIAAHTGAIDVRTPTQLDKDECRKALDVAITNYVKAKAK